MSETTGERKRALDVIATTIGCQIERGDAEDLAEDVLDDLTSAGFVVTQDGA